MSHWTIQDTIRYVQDVLNDEGPQSRTDLARCVVEHVRPKLPKGWDISLNSVRKVLGLMDDAGQIRRLRIDGEVGYQSKQGYMEWRQSCE